MIEILRAPPYATVQDRGFPTGRAIGLPEGGAMDRAGLEFANRASGNPAEAAGIEWSLGPLVLRLEAARRIAAVGPAAVQVNGTERGEALGMRLNPGETLALVPGREPIFCYLAIEGGVAVPPVLGSRSTYLPAALGGFAGRRLRAGDRLPLGPARFGPGEVPLSAGPAPPPPPPPPEAGEVVLRVTRGPQWDRFEPAVRQRFFGSTYQVARASDRAGYRLDGPAIAPREAATLPSEAACPGAIQVPDSGEPIVLMPDGPTVGGYPKLAVVARADLRRLAQCAPGHPIRFREVSLAEARRAGLS